MQRPMSYDAFISFLANLFNVSDNEPPAIKAIIRSIKDTAKRINKNDGISNEMQVYAHRLVNVYLPAVNAIHKACTGMTDAKAARLDKAVNDTREESLLQIESCLIDIEHGAVFRDNLGDIFFNCQLNFEQVLEARAIHN